MNQAIEEITDILSSFDQIPEISKRFPKYNDNTEETDAVKEAQKRILYFKHCLEDCDGYRIFYDKNGEPVRSEDKMQRAFKLVWYGTFYKFSSESNNGRGPADFVISRAGSGVINELLALEKPMLLIPLSKKCSRGDQIENAKLFNQLGYCEIIEEENYNTNILMEKLEKIIKNKEKIQKNMKKTAKNNAVEEIIKLIDKYIKK